MDVLVGPDMGQQSVEAQAGTGVPAPSLNTQMKEELMCTFQQRRYYFREGGVVGKTVGWIHIITSGLGNKCDLHRLLP